MSKYLTSCQDPKPVSVTAYIRFRFQRNHKGAVMFDEILGRV